MTFTVGRAGARGKQLHWLALPAGATVLVRTRFADCCCFTPWSRASSVAETVSREPSFLEVRDLHCAAMPEEVPLPPAPDSVALEQHVTPQQLADQWAAPVAQIQRRFMYEPGVIVLGRVMRIPQSVVARVADTRAEDGRIQFVRYKTRLATDGRTLERVVVGYQ